MTTRLPRRVNARKPFRHERTRLTAVRRHEPGPRVRLPVLKGRGGLVAGVDPLSNRSLREAVDDYIATCAALGKEPRVRPATARP